VYSALVVLECAIEFTSGCDSRYENWMDKDKVHKMYMVEDLYPSRRVEDKYIFSHSHSC